MQDNQDHKDLQRDDRTVKWVRDYNRSRKGTDSASICQTLGSETGLISDLHEECLRVMKEIRTAWRNSKDNVDLGPQERAGIVYCYGKLNLWGDTLQGGKLEASLEVVPTLCQTILEAFVKIGDALLLASRKEYRQSQITSSEQYQVPTSDLKVLIEKASHVLTVGESDGSTIQGLDATDEESPGIESASDTDGDEENSHELPTKSWVTNLLRVLNFRTKLLMDLLPAIQQILTTRERGYRPVKFQPPNKFHVSEAAQHWMRQIFDKFPDADGPLAERLGEANAQRYDELRREKGQDDTAGVVTERVHQPKSLFRPAATIHDSGLGTSIITPTEMPASVASHSSFLPSLADGTSRRVPKTPDAVALGIPFECEICGRRLSTIKDRTQWKAHVFTDIKPYVCTFNDCRDQLTVFPTRKLWAEHEFHNHRCSSLFECFICSQQLETGEKLLIHLRDEHLLAESRPQLLGTIIERAKKVHRRPIEGEQCPLCRRADWPTERAFVKHLGKHMEEIALLTLPLGEDSEEETETDGPYNEMSGATNEDKIECHLCECYFLRPDALKRHLRKQHGWREVGGFPSTVGSRAAGPSAGYLGPENAVPPSMLLNEPSVQDDSSLTEGDSQAADPDQPSQSHPASGPEQSHSASIPRPVAGAHNLPFPGWPELIDENPTAPLREAANDNFEGLMSSGEGYVVPSDIFAAPTYAGGTAHDFDPFSWGQKSSRPQGNSSGVQDMDGEAPSPSSESAAEQRDLDSNQDEKRAYGDTGSELRFRCPMYSTNPHKFRGTKCQHWRGRSIADVTRHALKDAGGGSDKWNQIKALSSAKLTSRERWRRYFVIFNDGVETDEMLQPYCPSEMLRRTFSTQAHYDYHLRGYDEHPADKPTTSHGRTSDHRHEESIAQERPYPMVALQPRYHPGFQSGSQMLAPWPKPDADQANTKGGVQGGGHPPGSE